MSFDAGTRNRWVYPIPPMRKVSELFNPASRPVPCSHMRRCYPRPSHTQTDGTLALRKYMSSRPEESNPGLPRWESLRPCCRYTKPRHRRELPSRTIHGSSATTAPDTSSRRTSRSPSRFRSRSTKAKTLRAAITPTEKAALHAPAGYRSGTEIPHLC